MPLTEITIRALTPRAKSYKVSDRDGLYLEVAPGGSKLWRYKYRYDRKEKRLALGAHPVVGLKEVRSKVADAKKLLADGRDPGLERKLQRAAHGVSAEDDLTTVLAEWVNKNKTAWSPSYAERVENTISANFLRSLGSIPLPKITAPMILACARKMESRGALDHARRALQWIKSLFRYAVATGRISASPLSDIQPSDVLQSRPVKSYPHLELAEVGPFLRALTDYPGRLETRLAVNLLLLTAVRTCELRGASWSEFDFKKSEWRIPAQRMKMKFEHIVPLSSQALALLTELRELTGYSSLLFPGVSNPKKSISENTINKAIRILGFAGRVVGHGFRSTFSTIANESGMFSGESIERQLAHKDRNAVRAIYDRSKHLDERRKIMQWWADTLDKELRTST